jgi:ActR/RegA family two-component response regulator
MKQRLLIVDDDLAITQQLFWTLSDEYDVIAANDLQSALRRSLVYAPEVALIDLHLPPTLDSPASGIGLLEYLKAHLPDSKVVVISSADSATRDACLQRGADEFLAKPFETEQILTLLRRLAPERQVDMA